MDQTLLAAPVPLIPAAPVELPWEVEPAAIADVRREPRQVASAVARSPSPERLHWPVIALTLLTAVTLVFASRADEQSRTWEFPASAGQAR